jgi:hypothetical protein
VYVAACPDQRLIGLIGLAKQDVLELYAQPYDPDRPVVGFDERPPQLSD